ncbi:MAG: valine--tRNA ligase, partial [Actinomycetota bacterium]
VKTRAYGKVGADGAPAKFADCSTDEVWSWWQPGSVHRATWPTNDATRYPTNESSLGTASSGSDTELLLDTASAVLSEIRRTKTEAKVSQRAKVSAVIVSCDSARSAAVREAQSDLVKAGSVTEFSVVDGVELSVSVTLAPAT